MTPPTGPQEAEAADKAGDRTDVAVPPAAIDQCRPQQGPGNVHAPARLGQDALRRLQALGKAALAGIRTGRLDGRGGRSEGDDLKGRPQVRKDRRQEPQRQEGKDHRIPAWSPVARRARVERRPAQAGGRAGFLSLARDALDLGRGADGMDQDDIRRG